MYTVSNGLNALAADLCRSAAAAVFGIFIATAATAQETLPDTVWQCWYNRDTRVGCQLTGATTGVPANPRYNDNPLFPWQVKQLWTDPAAVAATTVWIPLFTQPQDWVRVGQLAQAVMCGANPACIVNFTPDPIEAAQLAPTF